MLGGVRQSGWMRARFIIAFISLFAFSFQTYLVQTHIHGAAGDEISYQTSSGHKAPADRDSPDNCPICQAVALAGAFVTPTIIVLAVALTFVQVAPKLVLPGIGDPLVRRSWRSRAPPSV